MILFILGVVAGLIAEFAFFVWLALRRSPRRGPNDKIRMAEQVTVKLEAL